MKRKVLIIQQAIAAKTSRAIDTLNRRGKLFFSPFIDMIKK